MASGLARACRKTKESLGVRAARAGYRSVSGVLGLLFSRCLASAPAILLFTCWALKRVLGSWHSDAGICKQLSDGHATVLSGSHCSPLTLERCHVVYPPGTPRYGSRGSWG